jgi:hypothetical protein
MEHYWEKKIPIENRFCLVYFIDEITENQKFNFDLKENLLIDPRQFLEIIILNKFHNTEQMDQLYEPLERLLYEIVN